MSLTNHIYRHVLIIFLTISQNNDDNIVDIKLVPIMSKVFIMHINQENNAQQ